MNLSRIVRLLRWSVAAAFAAFAPTLLGQTTTYTYTGAAYTTASSPYALGGNLQGTLTLANPLPRFLPLTDISPAIVAFSFADEVDTRTLANSYLCSFRVATDGAGRITQWEIRLQRFPLNPADHHEIFSGGNVGVVSGVDILATGTGATVCGGVTPTSGANSSAQGSWISVAPRGAAFSVPSLEPVGMAMLAMLVAGLGIARVASAAASARSRRDRGDR